MAPGQAEWKAATKKMTSSRVKREGWVYGLKENRSPLPHLFSVRGLRVGYSVAPADSGEAPQVLQAGEPAIFWVRSFLDYFLPKRAGTGTVWEEFCRMPFSTPVF